MPDGRLTIFHIALKRGFVVKKKSRIETAKEILSRVKREMQLPRLTESVRNGEIGLAIKKPVER